jgi:hypothetical protein
MQQLAVTDAVYCYIAEHLLHLEAVVSICVLQAGDVEGIHGHYAQLGDTCENMSGLQ